MKSPHRRRKRLRKRQWDHADADTLARESRTKREDTRDSIPETAKRNYFTEVESNGLVISPYGVFAFVDVDHAEQLCRVDEALVDGKRSILAPGDEVLVEMRDGMPWVTGVRPRRSRLARPASLGSRDQVLAANVELLVIVAATERPPMRVGLVDRFLIAAEVGGVASMLCVNKLDLTGALPEQVEVYRALGLQVIGTSCATGEGIDALRAALSGRLAVLAGQSGVGKSSLLNALRPELCLETREISESTKKGRHTTTTARLYEFDDGARVIDTPGIRQFGLLDVTSEEVDLYFSEIAETATKCKFRDCTHTHEPACAVLEGVQSGAISSHRYQSYLRIRKSLED